MKDLPLDSFLESLGYKEVEPSDIIIEAQTEEEKELVYKINKATSWLDCGIDFYKGG